MLNLSLKELKLIAEKRGIDGYESISKDKLSSTFIASESVKKSEKNFDATESTRNEDYDADEILKTTKPDPTKTKTETKSKTRKDKSIIRKIREENLDKDKIIRDLDFIFNPEKDHYEPKKTASAFNNNYIQ